MKLSQTQPGDELTLELIIKGSHYEFKSNVIDIDDISVIAAPIRIQNKVLSVASDGVIVNLILIRTGKSPIVWRGVRVETAVYKKQTVYRITAYTLGVEENRRDAYRLILGIPAVAQIGTNTKAVDVALRDVSESGFSFVTKQDCEKPDGLIVRLVFTDNSKSFTLTGIVVRKEGYSDERFIYGCRLNQRMGILTKYINEKQRKQITEQNSVVLESHVPVGFGDLRKQEDDELNKVRALTEKKAGRSYADSDRYSNVNLNSDGKKVNYSRYKDLKL